MNAIIEIENRVLMSDSYKYSHFSQYQKNVVNMYDYAEARSDEIFGKTVFFGLQYILKKYFTKPITKEEVNEAQEYSEFHGIPFNKDGWDIIVNECNGYLPVTIKAIPEGKVVPNKNVLFTIELTEPDKRLFWIVSWLETTLMKVWYSCNIATRSYYIKEMLMEYANKTQDNPFVDYTLHNFGDRSSSSIETAAIGGMSHLVAFSGTDNFASIKTAAYYYNVENKMTIGHSIPATEHSTVTSWGKDKEFDMVNNFIEKFKNSPIIACVADSYDYFNFVNKITSGDFKTKIESEGYPIFVIRPDSGNPEQIIPKTLQIMEQNNVEYTTNNKGFKVFNKYRIIWGDGINMDSMKIMLDILVSKGYSTENIAFGMGGALMQGNENTSNNRDTMGFAIKCSNITLEERVPTGNSDYSSTIEYVEKEVFKDPKTAQNKKSKKGKVTTYFNFETNEYFTDVIGKYKTNGNIIEVLEIVFKNGKMVKEYTFEEVRNNLNT